MNRQSSHGFVLLLLLIFMQLFAWVGLHELTIAADTLKLNQHHWQHDQQLLVAKKILARLERMPSSEMTHCLIPITPAFLLAKKPLSWWQQDACSGYFMGNQYYYVFESLGKDVCGAINKKTDDPLVAADYDRLTLFWLPVAIPGARIILQSTIAKESDELASCPDKLNLVKAGRQMWREIQ